MLYNKSMRCCLKSLYLCVEDMERAICFYEDLFEQSVTLKDDIYSVFDIHGFRLGLFAYRKMNEKHLYGNNCLPSIEFENLELLKKIIDNHQVVFPLTKIHDNWVCEIKDSEGNCIEITAPVG